MFFVIPVPRIRVRQAPRPAPPPPAHFALTPSSSSSNGETALFQDHRVGFSHALPGWPQATHAAAGPGEPPADAMVQFWDYPMWLRYQVTRMTGTAPSATHVATDFASRYLLARTRDRVTPAPVAPERVAAWQVDAAATASYALVQPDAFGATHEDLTVLVREGSLVVVTRRHSGAAEDWVRHAAFCAATDATMLWHPQRYRYDAKIWPRSTFLEPMLSTVLLPERQQAVAGIAQALLVSHDEGAALAKVLEAMMRNDLPPWTRLSPEMHAAWQQKIAGTVTSADILDLLLRGFADVATAHDLRGFGVMTGTALSQMGGPA